jgi:hypothetical protein
MSHFYAVGNTPSIVNVLFLLFQIMVPSLLISNLQRTELYHLPIHQKRTWGEGYYSKTGRIDISGTTGPTVGRFQLNHTWYVPENL